LLPADAAGSARVLRWQFFWLARMFARPAWSKTAALVFGED